MIWIIFEMSKNRSVVFVVIFCSSESFAEMAASKYKRSMKTNVSSRLVVALNSLRKENSFLKKTLSELARLHAEQNQLAEVQHRVLFISASERSGQVPLYSVVTLTRC